MFLSSDLGPLFNESNNFLRYFSAAALFCCKFRSFGGLVAVGTLILVLIPLGSAETGFVVVELFCDELCWVAV
jgi:hypothetical protein